MLSDDELWKALEQLYSNGTIIHSIKMRSSHKIVATKPASREYTIEYTDSGEPVNVDFSKVSKMYSMLCEHGRLFNSDMEEYGHAEIGMTNWHIPGSAMLAILPLLDFRISLHEGAEAGLYRKKSQPQK